MLQKKEIFALLLKKIDVALSSFYEAARNIFFCSIPAQFCAVPYMLFNSKRCKSVDCSVFAEKGGFEPPVRLPVRQFSKLLV